MVFQVKDDTPTAPAPAPASEPLQQQRQEQIGTWSNYDNGQGEFRLDTLNKFANPWLLNDDAPHVSPLFVV